jgi:SMI1/KNR4 family protein SUKH-1
LLYFEKAPFFFVERVHSLSGCVRHSFFGECGDYLQKRKSMQRESFWQQTIQEYRGRNVQLLALEDDDAETRLSSFAQDTPPVPIETFLHLWKQGSSDPWQVLVQSAARLNPEVAEELTPAMLLGPFRSLLTRVEQGAILCWPPNQWSAFPRWGYLFQIASPDPERTPMAIVLHAPTSSEDIRAAEAALRLTLPPSYRRFLLLANGLGTTPDEMSWILGAGPQRANWKAVVLNQWLKCEDQFEIAAYWRAFQGTYDYERIRDWENGKNTFFSDETLLVPFAYTFETWCFDRTRSGANGEYPVIFWDHETREAQESYSDFSSWFAGEIEPYLFGLD